MMGNMLATILKVPLPANVIGLLLLLGLLASGVIRPVGSLHTLC
jgi:putative effector of murein hydrolase LrgA (UPF0299 family)